MLLAENPSAMAPAPGGLLPWHTACFSWGMRTEANILEPEPRRKPQGEETTRHFWQPALWDGVERRQAPRPGPSAAYLLAPPPWPRGQFRVDPEA